MREGNRLGARRLSLVVSWVRLLKDFIMQQPNLNSEVTGLYIEFLKINLVHYSDYSLHLVVLHMKLYLD